MFIKTKQVCDILNVAPNTVKSLVLKGELPAIRVGGGYRYRQEDIDDYIERQAISSSASNVIVDKLKQDIEDMDWCIERMQNHPEEAGRMVQHRDKAAEMLYRITDEWMADAKARTDKFLSELESRQAEQPR